MKNEEIEKNNVTETDNSNNVKNQANSKTATQHTQNKNIHDGVIEQSTVKNKSNKKGIMIFLAALIFFIAIFLGGFLVIHFMHNSKNEKPILYTSDNGLYMIEKLNKDKSKTVCISKDCSGNFVFSDNCSYVAYLERRNSDDSSNQENSCDLYVKNISDLKAEPLLITNSVSSVVKITGNVNRIYYIKHGDVYYSDIQGNIKKIVSDVYNVEYISDDETTMISTKEDNSVIVTDIESGKSKEIVSGSDSNNIKYSLDHKKIYYLSYMMGGYILWVTDLNGKANAISGAIKDYEVSDNGVYYISGDVGYHLYDFVEGIDLSSDIYSLSYEEYLQRELMDEIVQVGLETIYSSNTVYYYDGKESIKIISNVKSLNEDISTLNSYKDSGKIIVSKYKTPLSKIEKVDISDISSVDELKEYINKNTECTSVIVNKDSYLEIELGNGEYFFTAEYDDVRKEYLISSSTDESDLKITAISETATDFSKAEVIQNNIGSYFRVDGKEAYFDEMSNGAFSATLNFIGEKYYDMYPYEVMKDENGRFYFLSGHALSDRACGLYTIKNGKLNKIVDNLNTYMISFVQQDGKYLVIADDDNDDIYDGNLILVEDGETYIIDTKVDKLYNTNIENLDILALPA